MDPHLRKPPNVEREYFVVSVAPCRASPRKWPNMFQNPCRTAVCTWLSLTLIHLHEQMVILLRHCWRAKLFLDGCIWSPRKTSDWWQWVVSIFVSHPWRWMMVLLDHHNYHRCFPCFSNWTHFWDRATHQPGDLSSWHLNSSQEQAIRRALARHFQLLHGPPGTGKTRTAAVLMTLPGFG